jgi:hypothetical protein
MNLFLRFGLIFFKRLPTVLLEITQDTGQKASFWQDTLGILVCGTDAFPTAMGEAILQAITPQGVAIRGRAFVWK